MLSLIIETLRPWVIVALVFAQCFCVLAGLFMLLAAWAIHSGLGAAESLVFLAPAMVLTGLIRMARKVAI